MRDVLTKSAACYIRINKKADMEHMQLENTDRALKGYYKQCEKDPERAGRISSALDADNDWMWELLTK